MRIAVALNHEPAVPPVVRHTNDALGPDDDLPAQQPNGSAPAAPASTAAKSAYPPPAPVPTQEGPRGIRFDFNLGCRITLPAGAIPGTNVQSRTSADAFAVGLTMKY